MNEDNILNKISEIGIWFIAITLTLGYVLILFAPIFLPQLRLQIERKYIGFTYSNLLIEEEMNIYTKLVWTCSILGWMGFIFFLLLGVL